MLMLFQLYWIKSQSNYPQNLQHQKSWQISKSLQTDGFCLLTGFNSSPEKNLLNSVESI